MVKVRKVFENLGVSVRSFFVLVLLFPVPAFSERLPKIFYESPFVYLPISVGRSSYQFITVTTKSGRQKYDVPENEKYGNEMNGIQIFFNRDRRDGLLFLRNPQWSNAYSESLNGSMFWGISQLSCIVGVKCFLLSGSGIPVWLVLAKNGKITDFQLVYVAQYGEDPDSHVRGRIATLDTTFGDGSLRRELPVTHFRKTGIFCTEYSYGKYGLNYKVFKRRITKEGKLESKEIGSDYAKCTAPW